MRGQNPHQLILPLGQVQGLAVLADCHSLGIYGDTTQLQPFSRWGGLDSHTDAADIGLDPGQQLPHGEGLGDVVVGAQLQAKHLIRLLLPGGEHDDRGGPALSLQAAAHLEPVHLRQHQVQ